MAEDGKLFVFAINEIAPEPSDYFSKKKPEYTGELLLDKPIHVKEMPPLKQIACGVDHVLCLSKTGTVWAMGNDTFGQCGQGGENRQAVAPFFDVRHAKPVEV